MYFDSFSFIFLFLPLSIMIYYAVPMRFKNISLLLISLLFYFLLEPVNIMVLLLSIVTDFLLSMLMRLNDDDPLTRKAVLIASIIKNLFLIAYCGVMYQIKGSVPPIGIQIYSISAMDYMLGIYRREYGYETDFIRFALYCSFFPRIFAGPAVRWRDLAPQLYNPAPSLSSISSGMVLFCGGIAKKLLLADTLYKLYTDTASIGEVTLLSAWMLSFSALFSLYYALSSYCDMARGIARMLSITLPRNMSYPFSATNMRGFLSRFNITVGDFIKNALRSLKGETALSNAFYTLLVCMLMGIWFGFSINYLVWGLLAGLIVLAQKNLSLETGSRLPDFSSRIINAILVLLLFAIFATPSIASAGENIAAMFGFSSSGSADNASLYLLTSRYPVIIAAPVLSTRLARNAGIYLKNRAPAIYAIITVAACALLTFVSCVYML